ncbi:hypothetical protein [Hymenobacter jeollabukensis]|uniref:DUF5034 domain-containing protein n=1 Tax=Hymenobacter jeollabukensis TaxID=2025313 RepID=A0A5R8WRA3_9BACT|nr:hypothetical protein [Hymenobacter jeollabukensis]TLM93226.1 hypothetical protein FDY95_11425 [Hymenobacter jeollabukensis]
MDHTPMNHTRKMLLLGGLLLGLPACNDCGPFKQQYIDVNEARVLTERHRPGTSVVVVGAGETVAATELRLQLLLLGPAYSAVSERAGGFAAVACEPADPQYTETVDSLRVSSRYSFDATHPAGTSLNDLIQTDNGMSSLTDLLRTPQPVGRIRNERLRLAQAPASAGPQQFRVRVHLTNGEVYIVETPVLNVTP